MKVQIWSDFVCPFCYIGKRHLEQAIKELGQEVEIEMMSYELDPNYVDQLGLGYHELLAQKYDISYEEAKAKNEYAGKMAAAVGLNYNFEKMKYSNTFKAHKVFQLAKEKGIGNEVAEAFMEGFFTNGAYLNDDATLVKLGVENGLNKEEILSVLKDDSYGLKVRQDQQWARSINAKGVPHFVIDDKVSVSGAQPVTVFKQALSHVALLNATDEGALCTDEGCEI